MKKFTGIIPPLATPLSEPGMLDHEGLERLMHHVVSGGVSGIFLLGTTGEGPSLHYELRYELIERAAELAPPDVQVLVGITDTSIHESLGIAEHAASCGVDAVVAAQPYYFPIDDRQIRDYFLEVADRSPLPLMLYNMPSCTKRAIDLDTVAVLAEHPNVVGIKDSSGDMTGFDQLCQRFGNREDFAILIGPEEKLISAVPMGADGGVCGGANAFPELYVQLYRLAKAGRLDESRAAARIVNRVFDEIYTVENDRLNVIGGIKACLKALGICKDVIMPPLRPVSHDHEVRVQHIVGQIAQECESLA